MGMGGMGMGGYGGMGMGGYPGMGGGYPGMGGGGGYGAYGAPPGAGYGGMGMGGMGGYGAYGADMAAYGAAAGGYGGGMGGAPPPPLRLWARPSPRRWNDPLPPNHAPSSERRATNVQGPLLGHRLTRVCGCVWVQQPWVAAAWAATAATWAPTARTQALLRRTEELLPRVWVQLPRRRMARLRPAAAPRHAARRATDTARTRGPLRLGAQWWVTG
jgi:hypothetical protein